MIVFLSTFTPPPIPLCHDQFCNFFFCPIKQISKRKKNSFFFFFGFFEEALNKLNIKDVSRIKKKKERSIRGKINRTQYFGEFVLPRFCWTMRNRWVSSPSVPVFWSKLSTTTKSTNSYLHSTETSTEQLTHQILRFNYKCPKKLKDLWECSNVKDYREPLSFHQRQ